LLASTATAAPASARELTFSSYEMFGYEVFYAPDVGTFFGTGGESNVDLSTWYASIEHTLSIIPTGRITGGSATLYKLNGERIHGAFADGFVRLTNEGPNCTTETHAVTGLMTGVTSSAKPGVTGMGMFDATLTHYRAWILGRCYSYSASVAGTMTIVL
jgi:hypothetical protein